MLFALAWALLNQAITQQNSADQSAEITEHTISFTVRFAGPQSEYVQFGALLPAGWQFSIQIDGNQDGRWGIGEGMPTRKPQKTDDRQFALAPDGTFCPEYIITAHPQIPDRVMVATPCGELPSQGHAKISGTDNQGRTIVAIELPAKEVFGDKPSAHLQICIWNGSVWNCVYSPRQPLIIVKPSVNFPAVS